MVLQTSQPHHYAVFCAVHNRYEQFANEEFTRRKEINYPPFTRLFRFLVRSENEELLTRYAKNLELYLNEIAQENSLFSEESKLPEEILGPVQAPIYQVKKNYRMHLLAKSNSLQSLEYLAQKLKEYQKKNSSTGVYAELDFDPMDLL